MRISNQIQMLTPDQQARCYFAVISTDNVMADGCRQNNAQAMVRLRDGSMQYVRDLPQISADNPQPNGDYQITIDNNHSPDVADQSGAGWLYLDSDGDMHLMYCLSTNPAANSIRPLAEDHMLQFSTEGDLYDMSDDGVYGDFWIYAVAPVGVGNDPGTQSVNNHSKNVHKQTPIEKETKMADENTKVESPSLDQIKTMIKNELAKVVKNDADASDVMSAMTDLFAKLGITDPQWIADMVSDALNASAGMPYSDDDDDDDDGTVPDDPNATMPQPQNSKGKKNMKSRVSGAFRPVVQQPIATTVSNDFDKKKKSPEYLEAWGRALLEGAGRPTSIGVPSFADSTPIKNWMTKNDISFNPTDVSLTPEYVIGKVTELLQSDNSIYSHITQYNGTNQYTVPGFVTSTTYAKGRAKGSVADKTVQTATIAPRLIVAQSLFKFVSLPADFVDNAGGLSGASVVDWVTRELPAKVVRAAEEALIVGGVTNDDATSTPYTAISSIVNDVTASGSVYGTVYTPATGESLLKSLSTQVANVELLDNALLNTGVYVILSRTVYRQLINEALIGTGGFPANLAGSPQQIADFLGVDGIIQVPWLRPSTRETGHNAAIDTFTSTYQALIVNLSAVYGVGEMTPQALSQYYIRANSYDFESKMRIGAALGAPWSAVLVKTPATA